MTEPVIDRHVAARRKRGARAAARRAARVDPQALADVARAARRRAAAARPADRVPAPDPGRATAACRRRTSSRSRAEMKLAMTEVYEVATFYHHFDVVKEGEARAAARSPCASARRCRAQMAGGDALRASSPALRGARRARARRAVHRPLRARAGRGRRPQSGRPRDRGRRSRTPSPRGRTEPDRRRRTSTTPRTARGGGYRRCCGLRATASAHVDAVIADDGGLRPARPGRRRLSRRAASGGSCAPSRRRG